MWLMIVLSLTWVPADGQPAPDVPHGVPEQLRAHIGAETFTPLAGVGALPDPVKAALAQLFGTKSLDLAEPGAPFQATDMVVDPRLPWRRLIAAGCAADHCLVHYERGGFVHVYQVVVLSRQGDGVRFVWGGAVGGPIPNVHGVKDALATGKVLGQTKYW